MNTLGLLRNVTKAFQTHSDVNKLIIRHYMPRRALLYVPGNDVRKLNKTLKLDVDCVSMDCEDGVAINKKDAARQTIRELLDLGKPKKDRIYDWGVRVNSVDSGLCEEDLKALLTAKHLPDSLSLTKVHCAQHLEWLAGKIKSLIKQDKKIDLIIFIESAKAIIELPEICKKARELSKTSKFTPCSLVFGCDDLLADIGATKTDNTMEVLYARQKLVLVAKAYDLQAIDLVYIKYKDVEGLKTQSEEGARMGYTGKQVIHPDQVPIVQTAFLPNPKQIEWADGLLKAFNEHQNSGKGAFTYQGSMIDMPTMKQAQNIVKLVTSIKTVST